MYSFIHSFFHSFIHSFLSFFIIVIVLGQRGQERASTRAESWKILELGVTVECKLQTLGVSVPVKMRRKIYPGDRLILDGSSSAAMQAWVQHMELLEGMCV